MAIKSKAEQLFGEKLYLEMLGRIKTGTDLSTILRTVMDGIAMVPAGMESEFLGKVILEATNIINTQQQALQDVAMYRAQPPIIICDYPKKDLVLKNTDFPDSPLLDKYRAAHKEIRDAIKPGSLPGDGTDKTAERNGLILAANIITKYCGEVDA